MRELFHRLRAEAKQGLDPACADGTLDYLIKTAKEIRPKNFLEIGAGVGLTSIALLSETEGRAVAIENDPLRARKARENFSLFGVSDRATLVEGDAGEVLEHLEGEFDLIFLDGPKAQYRRYLPDCKRLLKPGGYLLSDDVLLYGWVRGEPPKKRRMLAEHLREYLYLIEHDPELETVVLDIAEGLAVSRKR